MQRHLYGHVLSCHLAFPSLSLTKLVLLAYPSMAISNEPNFSARQSVQVWSHKTGHEWIRPKTTTSSHGHYGDLHGLRIYGVMSTQQVGQMATAAFPVAFPLSARRRSCGSSMVRLALQSLHVTKMCSGVRPSKRISDMKAWDMISG